MESANYQVNVEDRLSRIETALAESAKKETHQAVVIENLKSSIKDLTSDVAYLTVSKLKRALCRRG
jgi:hypothetical protein